MKKTFLFSVVALLSISLAFMGCPNDSGSDDDDDSGGSLSAAKELVFVLGDTPKEVTGTEAEGKDGTGPENAKPYTVSPNTEATAVKVGDISVSGKAAATLYSDAEFNSPAPAEGIALTADVETAVYIKVIAEDTTEAFYKVGITVTPERSSDKAIKIILGGAPNEVTGTEAVGKDGTSKEKAKPYTVSLNTEATATATLRVEDIVLVSSKAQKALYSNEGFNSPAPTTGIALAAGADKDVYIKVTAEDLTDAYYKVTISITSDAPYARVTIVDGAPITGYANVKLTKSKEVRVELFNTTIKDEGKELKKNVNLIELGWITTESIDGLTAKLKEAVTPGVPSFTFTIAGTQATPLNEPLTLTIPRDYVNSGKDLAVNPGDANAQLTFTWKPVNQNHTPSVNDDIFDIAPVGGTLVGEDIKIYVKKDWKEVKVTTLELSTDDYAAVVEYADGDEPEEGVPLWTSPVTSGTIGRLILPVGAAKGQIKFVITEEAQDSQIDSVSVASSTSDARNLAVALGGKNVKVDPVNNKVTVTGNITSISGTPIVGSGQELIVLSGFKVTVGSNKTLGIGSSGTLTIEDEATVAASYFILGAGTWKSSSATITPNTLTLGSNATLGNGLTTGTGTPAVPASTVLSGSTFTASGAAVTLSQDGNGLVITGKTKSAVLTASSGASILVKKGLSLETVTLDITGASGIILTKGEKIALENENSSIVVNSASNNTPITGTARATVPNLTFGNGGTLKGAANGFNVSIGSFSGDTITIPTAGSSTVTINSSLRTVSDPRNATAASSTINGWVGIPLKDGNDITITFVNDTVKAGGIPVGTDVSSWFTDLPSGITVAKIKTASSGANSITISLSDDSNTPNTTSNSGSFSITIPGDSLNSKVDLNVSTSSVSFNISAAPEATVGSKTIKGFVGRSLSDTADNNKVTITVTNDTLASTLTAAAATEWFTGLPAGTITATATGNANSDTITITFSGTPNATSTAELAIIIPAGILKSGASVAVTSNASAKFAITPAPVATVDASGVDIVGIASTALSTDNTIEITLSNDTLKATLSNEDVSGWFSDLPSGLSATVTGNAGDNSITITVGSSNSASATSGAVPQTITIPADALTDNGEDLTVTGGTVTIEIQ